MMYVVVYFESYVGFHFDEYSKVFANKAKADAYCYKVNEQIAKENHCEIYQLGDWYEVIEIDRG